jgi:hypothetical protein
MSRLSYARVLVEVNLLSNLSYSIEVTLPNDSLLHQQVVYETLPYFCKHCRTLGYLTSTCTKSPPSNVPSKQPAHDSAPVPEGIRGKDSIFNHLGPYKGTLVVECLEVNMPANYVPTPPQAEAELISESGAIAPNSSGWEIVQRKKYRASLHPQDIFLGPLMLNLARPKGFLIWVTGIASLHLQSLFLPPYQHQLLMF